MRNDKTYLFHSDAGHGWLQVEREEIKELGLEQNITAYSFQRGRDVYLEEDYDLAQFFHAYMNKFGYKPTIIEPSLSQWVDYSPIRDFEMYVPSKTLTYNKIVVK